MKLDHAEKTLPRAREEEGIPGRGLDEGHVGNVYEQDVANAGLEGELEDGFEKRQPFDIAGRAANLGDEHVTLALGRDGLDAVLDLISDMRDDLHGLPKVFALALVVEDLLVHLAAGEVVHARELRAGEALVMAEVHVGFRAVVQHIDLSVLVGAHGAGVDVEVRVELLKRDLEAAVLEQGAERGRRQPLAERAHHAACDEDVFHLFVKSLKR